MKKVYRIHSKAPVMEVSKDTLNALVGLNLVAFKGAQRFPSKSTTVFNWYVKDSRFK